MHQRQQNHGRAIRMIFKWHWLVNIQRASKLDIEKTKYKYETEIVIIIKE